MCVCVTRDYRRNSTAQKHAAVAATAAAGVPIDRRLVGVGAVEAGVAGQKTMPCGRWTERCSSGSQCEKPEGRQSNMR